VEAVRSQAASAYRAAGSAVDAVNVSSTHLQRFLQARRRELDALSHFRLAVAPLRDAAASPTPLPVVRDPDELPANSAPWRSDQPAPALESAQEIAQEVTVD
jgi:DNA recombination protein RmuC